MAQGTDGWTAMRAREGRFQLRLRSLVLVVTAYSVWLGIQVSRREVGAGGVWGWLFVCVAWSLLAAVVAGVARSRGQSPLVWFIAALVVNPLVAWLGMVLAGELRATGRGGERRGSVKGREAG